MTANLGPEPELGLTLAPQVDRAAVLALIQSVGLDPADVIELRIEATRVEIDTVQRDAQGRIKTFGAGFPYRDLRTYALSGSVQPHRGATIGAAPTPKDTP